MSVSVVGNTRALKPVDPKKIQELLDARNALYEAVCIWTEKNSRSLNTSIHAPKNESVKNRDSARIMRQTRDSRPLQTPSVDTRHVAQTTTRINNRIIKDPAPIKMVPSTEARSQANPSPVNREATSPRPEASAVRGMRKPEDFMAQWRASKEAKRVAMAPLPLRRVIFKNVPDWATFSDVLCLVFGGPIERIWSENPNEVTVQFIEEADCKKYFEAFRFGIRVGDHLVEVEQTSCDPLTNDVKGWITTGTTRCVQVDVPNEKTFQELHDVAKDLDIDHLMYHTEPNKPGRAYFFFCNLNSGCAMMKNLLQRDWLPCPARFFTDPCEVAQGFHANTIPASRMSEASPEVVHVE